MEAREAAVLARLFDRLALNLEDKHPNLRETWEIATTARDSLEFLAGPQECENLARDLNQLEIWKRRLSSRTLIQNTTN